DALTGHRDAFETIFGIEAEDQVLTNASYNALLSSILGRPGYDQTEFIAALDEAAALHDALDYNALRDVFAGRHVISVDMQNSANPVYIATLFGIVGEPGYSLVAFIDGLNNVGYLWYGTGELKTKIYPTGVVFGYYKSGNLKSELYPNTLYQEFEDFDFYGGNRGRVTKEKNFDGFTLFMLNYYTGTDSVLMIGIYDENSRFLEFRWFYADGTMQKVETADGHIKEFDTSGNLVKEITPE
ncbi:unnamed protein product, partial [marine sediment metagenome]